MNIYDKLTEMLQERGMFDAQCSAVMDRVMQMEENESMQGRWQDMVEDYPTSLIAVLWLTTKDEALKYIDEVCPLAWFRPMFTEQS